ncbi:hypothetical protein GCAAIG_11810 [Candidatus Electronema halotolerans]
MNSIYCSDHSPDCIIRLNNEAHLILETKGQDNELAHSKREYLRKWVEAVNNHGGFGPWHEAVAASFYQRFVYIHPFNDGNGRIARFIVEVYLIYHQHRIDFERLCAWNLNPQYVDCASSVLLLLETTTPRPWPRLRRRPGSALAQLSACRRLSQRVRRSGQEGFSLPLFCRPTGTSCRQCRNGRRLQERRRLRTSGR